MLAVLTTHRVTRAVLVLVVGVCSIRLAGPALCATMTGMADSSSAVQMRRWTRQEYDRMIEAGVLMTLRAVPVEPAASRDAQTVVR